jgi:hypothetical protein
MFAALSTVEPLILELGTARLLEGDKSWSAQRMPLVEDRVRNRWPTFPSPWRCRLARWSVQRGRPDDGVGAAQVESVGYAGRLSEPLRLCGPRLGTVLFNRVGRRPELTEAGTVSPMPRLTASSNLHFWPSQTPGSDDHLPEEHTKARNHNNAKDKTPRVENRGGVVAGGQPVGIAHAKLLGRPPAS